MAKRAVFVNLGFDPTAALDVVSALSMTSGEILVLVYPADTEESSSIRAEQARNAVKSQVTLLRAAGRRIKLDELSLDLRFPGLSLERLIDKIVDSKNNGYSVVLELTGGVRTITILMVMVSMWFPGLVNELSFIVEVTRQRMVVPAISPLSLASNSSLKVLACIARNSTGIRRRDVARALQMSEGIVSRAASRLKKMGLIDERIRVLTISERCVVLLPLFKRAADLSQR